jgi:hypothetical protein
MKLLLAFSLLLAAQNAASADCYVGAAGGRSTVNYGGIDRIEERIFSSGYANGDFREKKSSTTAEFSLGCVLSRKWGLKAELAVLEGFEHFVHTRGTLTYQGFSEDFTVDRIVRARGYLLSGIWEKQLSAKTYLFGRLGALKTIAMADVRPMGTEYSVHAEKNIWVPLFGAGARVSFDDRWSVVGEYRVLGDPFKKKHQIEHLVIGGQYSFR